MFPQTLRPNLLLLIAAFVLVGACSFPGDKQYAEVNDLLLQGNAELREKRYGEAIRFYDEALKLAPDEPVLISNKSTALRSRGADIYNHAIKIKDPNQRSAGIERAKSDIKKSAEVSQQAVKIINGSILYQLFDTLSAEDAQRIVLAAHAESMRLVASVVDGSKADAAVAAMEDYIRVEPESEKRLKVRLAVCKLRLESGRGDLALDGYRQILTENPDELEAILGVGLALSQSGDKPSFEEAKTYLRRFLELAPDSHPMKADIIQTLEYMN